ncbi:MAG: amino acid ABC transporter substrate-binding protein, partial [Betaproteobacteria bacterium]|nr:amino acid ABC transporter substrate-binding protein [Betaproteobacteria bacterium]
MFKLISSSARTRFALASLLMAAVTTTALAAEPLRVCSDPDNLPFSKSDG